MELAWLIDFVALNETGNFSRAAELRHIDDWTRYLSIVDEKLAAAVDRLEAAIAEGTLEWPALDQDRP